MFSSSSEYTNLDNAYTKPSFEFSRTMYPVHTNIQFPNISKTVPANWQSEDANNADLVAKTGITTNWQYRKYLTENAKDIIEYNYRESNNENGHAVRHANLPVIQCNKVQDMTNVPRMQTNMLDMTHRYGKPASDLKNAYLTREHAQMMQIAPVIARK
jgi:hypothetical protein